LRAPDRVVGLAWTGAFDADRLAAALAAPPPGVTELYFHPATGGGFPGAAPGYRYAEELAALLDPRARAACAGLSTGGYAAMLASAGSGCCSRSAASSGRCCCSGSRISARSAGCWRRPASGWCWRRWPISPRWR
ncbi:MAG: hypothetical protein AAGC69_23945, partial [Paracraurococcus sp.]